MAKLRQNPVVGRKGDKLIKFRNLLEDHLSLEEFRILKKEEQK